VAEDVLQKRVESLTPEERARLKRALAERKAVQSIPRRQSAGPAPLSYSQEALWFLEQWNPGAPTNHGVRAFRLSGDLHTDALEAALRTLVHRHESLRSVIRAENGRPVQVALDDWQLALRQVDVTEEELADELRAESRRPFDLERDLMLRPSLFRLAPDDHVLLLTLHHIAADGWSGAILVDELSKAYSAHLDGNDPRLPELPIQYADFATWQRERLAGSTLEELVRYWSGALEGAPERLRLPTDRARPEVQAHRGRHTQVGYNGHLAEAVARLAREESATSYMVLLAAFATLLYRFSGQQDIVVGTPVANRNHVELERLTGLVSNTLVIRCRLDGNPTFRELVRRVREAVVGAFEHQELPFEKLVESLRVPRNPAFNPVFQVNFRATSGPRETLELPGVSAQPLNVDIGFSRFDLALELQLDDARLGGYFEFDDDLFDVSTIEGLKDDFGSLLQAIAAVPNRPILALLPSPRPRPRAAIRRISSTTH
jgi:hypothetical protein